MQQGWPPSSSSSGGALRGLLGPCRAWPVGLCETSHTAYRCGPSLCVSDDDDYWHSSSYAFPHLWGLILDASKPSSSIQDQDAAACVLLHGSSLTLGVARTGPRRNRTCCQSVPACSSAGCLDFHLLSEPCSSLLLRPTPPPPRFPGVFSGTTPPFVQPPGKPVPPSAPGLAFVASTVTQPDAVNPSQGPSPAMIKSWKEDFMREIKSSWAQFLGDDPPQPTVGPSVRVAIMGPDALRQLSPSDDREALQAQRKAGSKRADSGVRQSSRSSERSCTDRHLDRVRHRRVSPDSSSPTRRLSPPAKRSRLGGHHAPRRSSSSEGRERSPRARLPRRSRSPLTRRRGHSPSSSSQHHRSRDCLVGLSRLARLGGLLDNRPCRHAGDHLHLSGGHDDHPGVDSHLLRYGPGPPIVIPPYHPPGHLHLEDVGLVVCPRAVSAPGHPAGIVSLDRTQLTNTSYASVSTMATNIHVILQSQNNQPKWMTLSCKLIRFKNCLQTFWTILHFLTTLIHCRIIRRATSWYHMILLPLLLLLLLQESM